MPAEAQRLSRRLGTRDRWFLAVFGFAALVGTVIAIVLTATSSASADTRCITSDRAWWMGSATRRYCGADAVAFCRRAAPEDTLIALRCAKLDLDARRP